MERQREASYRQQADAQGCQQVKVLKSKNTWEAPTPQDEKLIALEAKIQKWQLLSTTKKLEKSDARKDDVLRRMTQMAT